ncbi:transglutaminase domain-containing protein [Butyrivibrio fibrisolvens]|uniref:transglutaminase domain-containing protein n=1 Tax=Butyrivibrio fibrisolvens TaxID=831 RepID=UPI000407ED31|nr:transglutaminase domain-containing protein [Butyrivibrio fibrisolvens]
MVYIREDMDLFDACSTNYAFNEIGELAKAKSMQQFYIILSDHLKYFYSNPKDAEYAFEDPLSKKHCWKFGDFDFANYSLTWDEALRVLQAVYADHPLLFFADKYKTGGYPQGGTITPIIDAECARGDFRCFYASKIENEIRRLSGDIIVGTGCREAALKVYHRISNDTYYDDSKGDGYRIKYTDIPSHSVLNFVRNRAAVCESFALVYQAVMNYLSIPAVEISVNTKNGKHACNFIYLTDDKKWIMVDPTLGVTCKNESGFDLPVGTYDKWVKSPEDDEYHANMPDYSYIWNRYLEQHR